MKVGVIWRQLGKKICLQVFSQIAQTEVAYCDNAFLHGYMLCMKMVLAPPSPGGRPIRGASSMCHCLVVSLQALCLGATVVPKKERQGRKISKLPLHRCAGSDEAAWFANKRAILRRYVQELASSSLAWCSLVRHHPAP